MAPSIYDVVVIGGGIVGASAAYALSQSGASVILIEQFEPGHTRGSSHGDGRIIRLNYPEPIYLEMALLTYSEWETLSRRSGRLLLQKTGILECGPAGCLQLADLEANLQQFHIVHERFTANEVNRRFPYFRLESGSEAIYQSDGAIIFADPAIKILWQLAKEAGAELIGGCRIEVIEATDHEITLRSQSGENWRSKRLVVAAGAWAKQLLLQVELELPLLVTQEQNGYFPAKDNLSHLVGAMPCMIDYRDAQHPFYALPQVEVAGVKAGWNRTGAIVHPDHPQAIDEDKMQAVRDWIQARFPHLQTTPIATQTCLYTNSPDYHFIVDQHPALPNIIIAAGFSGHGFKFGPVLGLALAALAQDMPPPVDLRQFALARFERPADLRRRMNV